MKCPVCDQNSSTMLCPQCAFDASMDYEKYPTFALIEDGIPAMQIRRQEAKNTSGVEKDHYMRELIHKCSEALVKIDAQQGEIRSLQLRLQNTQGELRQAQQENAQLEEINSKLITEKLQLTKHIHTQSTMLDARAERINMLMEKIAQKKSEFEEQSTINSSNKLEIDKLANDLSDTRKRLKAANDGIRDLRIEMNKKDDKIVSLENEITRLKGMLEEEQDKSLFTRIFNR